MKNLYCPKCEKVIAFDKMPDVHMVFGHSLYAYKTGYYFVISEKDSTAVEFSANAYTDSDSTNISCLAGSITINSYIPLQEIMQYYSRIKNLQSLI